MAEPNYNRDGSISSAQETVGMPETVGNSRTSGKPIKAGKPVAAAGTQLRDSINSMGTSRSIDA
jgi:hypothetical protein